MTYASDFDALAGLCDRRPEHPRPSAMLVLAHPADETVGAATLLPGLGFGRFVYLTDGAPREMRDVMAAGCPTREEYAAVRRAEAISALDSVGVIAHRVEFLDCVDQEASAQLVTLARWVELLIREHAPRIILTHPYEGGHPDHDAAAFVVRSACRQMESAGSAPPLIAEFTSYHAAEGRWRFGEFLPPPRERKDREWPSNAAGSRSADRGTGEGVFTRVLNAADRELKLRLIGCYSTQRELLHRIPLRTERFRIAPDYVFTEPPHPGRLLYETLPWGMTGAEWRSRTRAALAELSRMRREAAPARASHKP